MTRRSFTPEFKRKVVEEHLVGRRTIAEICREYHLGRNVFARWRQAYRHAAAPAGPSVETLSWNGDCGAEVVYMDGRDVTSRRKLFASSRGSPRKSAALSRPAAKAVTASR